MMYGTFAILVTLLACPCLVHSSHHHPHLAGNVIQLTDETFEHDTQVSTGGTTGDWFVKFYAPWCGHCRKLAPVWSELAAEMKGVVNIADVDCTQQKGLASRFDIRSYPTLIYFRNGAMHRYEGPRSLEALTKYAKGGYSEAESKTIPQPEDLLRRLKREATRTATEMAQVVHKTPLAGLVIFVSGGFGGFILGFLIAYAACSAPKPFDGHTGAVGAAKKTQ